MSVKRDSFTYRHADSIQAFGLKAGTLLVATRSKLVEWDRMRRRAIREVSVRGEITDVKCLNGYWILLTKNSVELFDGDTIEHIGPKRPLDASIAYKDWLLIVGNEEITVISIRKGNAEARKVRLISNNGICTCGASSAEGLFLSFENGKVFSIGEPEVMGIVLGKADEVLVDELPCLIFLKEAIVSINVLEKDLVVSLFNKKVLVLSLETREVLFTELLYNIKCSTIWNEMIVINDCKNNILFLDRRLVISYSNCLKEEICGVLADGDGLAVGFTIGVVKEYVTDGKTRPGFVCEAME
ncbi:hypothetical protein PFJ87_06g01200 [Encephalitozoon hellem]|uniref:Uncharacterized protein n=1 Tax=Encephalitozoon hellem TaxID=27973 RepID=A0ABY8CIW8_ENCHE|nr:hypothetical protein PFJ87_06g01200 [Encephalitozoon hellem]